MSKLVTFINEIIQEDKYSDEYNSRIIERLNTFTLKQLDHMYGHLMSLQSSSHYTFDKKNLKHILECMTEIIKKKLEEQELKDKKVEEKELNKKRIAKKNEIKEIESKRLMQVIEERAQQHAEADVREEVLKQKEIERIKVIKLIALNESRQKYLVFASTLCIIVLLVVFVIYINDAVTMGVLIGVFFFLYALILLYAYKMTRLEPKKIPEKEILKKINERRLIFREEAFEKLKLKEHKFNEEQKKDRQERRKRRHVNRESQRRNSQVVILSIATPNYMQNQNLFNMDQEDRFDDENSDSDSDDDENVDSKHGVSDPCNDDFVDDILPPLPPQSTLASHNNIAGINEKNTMHSNAVPTTVISSQLHIQSLSLIDIMLMSTESASRSQHDTTVNHVKSRGPETTVTAVTNHLNNHKKTKPISAMDSSSSSSSSSHLFATICYIRIKSDPSRINSTDLSQKLNQYEQQQQESHSLANNHTDNQNDENESQHQYQHFLSNVQLIDQNKISDENDCTTLYTVATNTKNKPLQNENDKINDMVFHRFYQFNTTDVNYNISQDSLSVAISQAHMIALEMTPSFRLFVKASTATTNTTEKINVSHNNNTISQENSYTSSSSSSLPHHHISSYHSPSPPVDIKVKDKTIMTSSSIMSSLTKKLNGKPSRSYVSTPIETVSETVTDSLAVNCTLMKTIKSICKYLVESLSIPPLSSSSSLQDITSMNDDLNNSNIETRDEESLFDPNHHIHFNKSDIIDIVVIGFFQNNSSQIINITHELLSAITIPNILDLQVLKKYTAVKPTDVDIVVPTFKHSNQNLLSPSQNQQYSHYHPIGTEVSLNHVTLSAELISKQTLKQLPQQSLKNGLIVMNIFQITFPSPPKLSLKQKNKKTHHRNNHTNNNETEVIIDGYSHADDVMDLDIDEQIFSNRNVINKKPSPPRLNSNSSNTRHQVYPILGCDPSIIEDLPTNIPSHIIDINNNNINKETDNLAVENKRKMKFLA